MIQLIVFAVCLLFLFMEWILLTFITGERFAELSPYVLICDGDDNFLRTYIQTSQNCKFKIEYINKYFSNLVNVTSIFTIKLYRLRLWYLGCRFNFTLISGKSIKISAVIMAVLLVPYYGQHIYSNVVSFEAIRNMCFSLLSILFVCLYNGQHGSKKKWIYYWAYPLHILFFAILRC